MDEKLSFINEIKDSDIKTENTKNFDKSKILYYLITQ